ncbi:rhodanese-like domain-containing protein [Bacteroides salyersiae]|jgi:rhodanese-related sulfurtransferase|uniref:rhodanese-like domain-containing protein n=1 Tax=Bacteroides salyersiae TaxID=291644 RepID=UPI001C8C77D1|nr:rhodanese-like domain-containing protein [Bacteroides salyersiae]
MKKWLLLILTGIFTITVHAQETKYTTLPNKEFAQTIQKEGVQFFDVRTPAEYAEKHIPKAKVLDFKSPDFISKVDSLDKSQPVALYCLTGQRSKKAATAMAERGFQVYVLDNGLQKWKGKTEK